MPADLRQLNGHHRLEFTLWVERCRRAVEDLAQAEGRFADWIAEGCQPRPVYLPIPDYEAPHA